MPGSLTGRSSRASARCCGCVRAQYLQAERRPRSPGSLHLVHVQTTCSSRRPCRRLEYPGLSRPQSARSRRTMLDRPPAVEERRQIRGDYRPRGRAGRPPRAEDPGAPAQWMTRAPGRLTVRARMTTRRQSFACALAALALVAAACANEKKAGVLAGPATPPSNRAPMTREAAAPDASGADDRTIVRGLCGLMRVASTSGAARTFEASMRRSCESDLLSLVDRGAISISEAAWRRCQEYARTLSPPTGWELLESEACRDVLVPRRKVGDPCAHKLECASASYCDDVETHRCASRIPVGGKCLRTLMGEPCAPGSFCSANVCRALEKRGATCSGHCEAGLFCVNDTCREGRGALGERCYPQDRSCAGGLRCSARLACEERAREGAACVGADDCASGACTTDPRGTTACR
jgi:hypothetical protein